MPPKEKIVIITGAGAVLPWRGPKTSDLTDILVEDQDFITNDGRTVGKFLQDLLVHNYGNASLVNFETIIHSIETLYAYFRAKDPKDDDIRKASLPTFFEVHKNIEEALLCYHKYESIEKNGQSTYFSKCKRIPFFNIDGRHTSLFFHLYDHFISLIVDRISKYSESTNLESRPLINKAFSEFLNNHNNRAVLRFYTTNYDRIPCLLSNVHFNEGFSEREPNTSLTFNREQTLLNEDSPCYFNLHGSIHFDMALEWHQHPNKVLQKLSTKKQGNFNQGGGYILQSNIITGFNKEFRVLQEPFSFFYHRLAMDCAQATRIYTIGYSYGDLHINNAIFSGVNTNKAELHIIGHTNNILRWSDDFRKKQPFTPFHFVSLSPDDMRNGWFKFGDSKTLVYTLGFEEFLKNAEWTRY